jgi:hypothetical protein
VRFGQKLVRVGGSGQNCLFHKVFGNLTGVRALVRMIALLVVEVRYELPRTSIKGVRLGVSRLLAKLPVRV